MNETPLFFPKVASEASIIGNLGQLLQDLTGSVNFRQLEPSKQLTKKRLSNREFAFSGPVKGMTGN